MVQPIQSPFMWGADGKPKSPAQVAQQRRVAEALLAEGPQGKGWASALGQAVQGLGAKMNFTQADFAEEQGREAAGNLFAGIAPGSSTEQIAAALADPASAWATPVQTSVAQALMQQNMERADPAYQLDLAYKQAQIDAMQQEASGAMGGSSAPANVQEWQYYSQLTPEEQAQYLTMKRSNSPLNLGTHFATQNPAMPGEVMGAPIPIYNEQEAYDTATGAAQGALDVANAASLPQAIATAEQGIANIEALESDPNLWSAVGPLGMLPAVPGTSQAGVVSRIEQLQGGAFLTAYNSLKGGGAISEVEGKKAEQAIARLNRAQNETDFRSALKDLKDVIRVGTEIARKKAGQSSPAEGPTANPVIRIYNPATGRLE